MPLHGDGRTYRILVNTDNLVLVGNVDYAFDMRMKTMIPVKLRRGHQIKIILINMFIAEIGRSVLPGSYPGAEKPAGATPASATMLLKEPIV